jgi:hypothetical protein
MDLGLKDLLKMLEIIWNILNFRGVQIDVSWRWRIHLDEASETYVTYVWKQWWSNMNDEWVRLNLQMIWWR